MKKLATSIFALSMMTGGVAIAENHSMMGAKTSEMGAMQGKLIRSRDITGGTIYTMRESADWVVGREWNELDDGWEAIGEIEDLVLSRDGQVTGIVAEIGGFLDIGDKHVVISLDDMNLVAVDDKTFAYVTQFSEEQLEELPGVDEGWWD